MSRISQAAEQEIRALLTSWWTAVSAQLAAVTGETVQIGEAPADLLFQSDIGQRMARIAETAEAAAAAEAKGRPYPWNEKRAAKIVEDCEAVEAWLNQGPFSHKTPEAFWTSPVGFMILCAKVWAHQDQLITLSTAATISGMSLSVLSQRMTRGQLPGYRDPSIKNPKHARRVRLSDLHTLIGETSEKAQLASPYLMPRLAGIPAQRTPSD